jgi:AraC family transcriptional regulator
MAVATMRRINHDGRRGAGQRNHGRIDSRGEIRVALWGAPAELLATMLRYMNRGPRLGQTYHPLGLKRGNWEFFAVVKGSMRPVFPEKNSGPFQGSRLWLMPPESPHAWFTAPAEPSEIFVFHFAFIHPQLESALPTNRMLSIPIGPKDHRMLAALYRQLLPHYQSPLLVSTVHAETAMLQLCTLFLERSSEVSSMVSFDAGSEKVMHALQWHRQHFAEGVNVKEVASALHMSPGHLRRLFLKLHGETPKKVFLRATIDEACRILAKGDITMKEVAAQCGFAGFSEFYRAFKRHTGQSPSEWRKNPLSHASNLARGARNVAAVGARAIDGR